MRPAEVYDHFERDLHQDPDFGAVLPTIVSLAGALLNDKPGVVRTLDRFVTLYGRSRGYTVQLEDLER